MAASQEHVVCACESCENRTEGDHVFCRLCRENMSENIVSTRPLMFHLECVHCHTNKETN